MYLYRHNLILNLFGKAKKMKRLARIITMLAMLAMCLPASSTQGSLQFVDDYADDDTKGRFVMEAESYAARTSAPDAGWWEVDGASHEFIEGPSAGQVAPTATGGARENYMEVLGPTIGEIPPIDASYDGPFMDYKILVEATGSYRLYVRWRGRTGGTDSLYAYILKPDGTLLTDAGPNYFLFHQYRSSWIWDNKGVKNTVHCAGAGFPHDAVWTIAEPGVYTIRIAQRETESALDALLFQTSNLSAPSGQGPAQSQLRGGLQALEITGPDEVAENHQSQYHAIAHYDNNSTQDVTASAVWSVDPNTLAAVDQNGLLTTQPINYLTEDITIYARYTEDSNTVDAEKAVSVFAVCPSGSALEFDGEDDYVSCGTGPAITGTGPFAVSAWVKTDSVKGHAIVVQRSESSANGSYGLSILADGRIQSHTYNGGYGLLFQSDVTVDDGLWHHVAVVRTNSTDGEIYVDGSLSGSDSGPAKSLNNVPVWIGGPGFTGPFVFDGLIDDVRIWSAALTQEEIQATMHIALDGSEPNLVGYWDFDEGEGQVAYDLSSNANHGRLGSDPNADDSDPAWVASDAPVGICTADQLIERHVTDALQIKHDILAELDVALTKEDAAFYILQELFITRDTANLTKRQILMLRQLIHSALQNQQRSEDTLQESIEKLEDASAVLDGDNNVNAGSATKRQLQTLVKPATAVIQKPLRK